MLSAILRAISIMDNIRAYEVRDGGSIPSWRTNQLNYLGVALV